VDAPLPRAAPASVAERLRGVLTELAPAERRVARAVLAGYPMSGLDTVAVLAERAGTSPPTVLRVLAKAGFDGYPLFQRAVKAELAERLTSPADRYPPVPTLPIAGTVRRGIADAVAASLDRLPQPELDGAADLLADPRRSIWTVGGRFTGVLAEYLALHLRLIRPGVTFVGPDPSSRTSALLDVGRRSVLVAFDYRRYQPDTIEFGACAAGQGAHLVLVTDHLLSPLAAQAHRVLATTGRAGAPFDVFTPAMAVVETLVAAVLDRLGDRPRHRMARHDRLAEAITGGRR
jgi:DNA-binding MurR/RpiR family transcriptional regulator